MVISVEPAGTWTVAPGAIALPRMVMRGQAGSPHSPGTMEPSDALMIARTATAPETPGWVALIRSVAAAKAEPHETTLTMVIANALFTSVPCSHASGSMH